MSEPRDNLDQWLDEPVRPMLPPPGTFELVRKRARRRKVTHAALSAAGVAAVVAVGVTLPQLVAPTAQPPSRPLAGSQTSSPTYHSGTTHPAATSSTPVATPTAGGGLPPVPANFQVSSVTFIGSETGWVLGQAGTPGYCGPPSKYICTSIARTDDAGQSWYGVPAPVAGAPNGSAGVSQVRFLNTPGWAFGPQLFATHDSGATWAQVATGGARVTGLETVGSRVFAVWADCQGTGADFAAGCKRFSLYSSPATADRWAPVRGVTGLSQPGGGASSAFLVLTGSRGYLMAPDGKLYSGPASRASGWRPVTNAGTPVTLPCSPGPAQADGVPSHAFLASTGPGLVLFCPGISPGSTQPDSLYYSPDGGASWQSEGTVPVHGTPTSLSGSVSGAVLVATTRGIEVATGPSGPWRVARGVPAGGITYVGMTETNQGVAVAARQSLHGLWFTFSSGLRWGVSRVP